ncbi:hypothetical protein ACCUM_3128 [Candidatus Accumulibacter phosphatis]|uniref:Ice-binding protein C-terminal domain-containing protein n=1 Tax=Candidatus Accumulibacter phosphatis TaxID=327160 RepID=A0A5S4EQ24_9PROT|nr:hypothetical protein ACCUM_3128 [Candidatus Accumulibacter phosphatis]
MGTGKSVTFTVDDLSLTGFDDIALTPACVANCNNVPEPTTLAVLGLGLAGLWFGRRQRI